MNLHPFYMIFQIWPNSIIHALFIAQPISKQNIGMTNRAVQR